MKARVNDTYIDYRDEGRGIPVLFIHAFPLNQTMWDAQVAAATAMCRAITIDLRGFGQSDVRPGPYSMSLLASDVRALMITLGIDRAVLVGLSMGGYVTMAFCREYPEAVRAIVLADTRAASETVEGRERRLKSAEKAEREGARAIAGDLVPFLLAPSTITGRPDIVQRVRQMAEATSPLALAAAQRGMAERPDSSLILAKLNRPAQIIVGSHDVLSPPAEAASMQRNIPGARLEIIEGAGHLSNMERPEEFNAALAEFIDSLVR